MTIFRKLVENNKIFQWIEDEVNSIYFIVLFALFATVSSLFGLEMYFYTFFFVSMMFVILFCKNAYPMAGMLAFMYFTPSIGSNPADNMQSVFYPENGLVYFIVIIVTFITAYAVRVADGLVHRRIEVHFPKLTWGFLALGIAYMIGGVGYEEYTSRTIFFGFIEIASLCLFYFMFAPFIKWKEVPKNYLSHICSLVGIFIILQLLYICHTKSIVSFEGIKKGYVFLGWGISNNIGSSICMMIPMTMYLATQKKYGFIFIIEGAMFVAAIILTQSRTSIASSFVVFILSSIFVLIGSKGKNKVINGIILLLIVGVAIFFFYRYREKIQELLNDLFNFEEEGTGRLTIYREGIELFRRYPIFGTGFYSFNDVRFGSGASFIPGRWHNTYVQIAASCGVVGMIAYAFHRIQTMIILFRRPSVKKFTIFLCILALLLTSVLDCHFFNIGPGLLYGLFLAFIEGENNEKQESVNQ